MRGPADNRAGRRGAVRVAGSGPGPGCLQRMLRKVASPRPGRGVSEAVPARPVVVYVYPRRRGRGVEARAPVRRVPLLLVVRATVRLVRGGAGAGPVRVPRVRNAGGYDGGEERNVAAGGGAGVWGGYGGQRGVSEVASPVEATVRGADDERVSGLGSNRPEGL